MNLKKWIYLSLFLGLFYFIFIANFLIAISVIFGLYIAFKLYKVYARMKLNKLSTSKELFAQSELGLFIALVAKVAKADGRVHELEAQLISNMFDDISKIFNEKQKTRSIMKEIFNEHKLQSDNVEQIAKALNDKLGRTRFKRKQFMGFLIQLAFVDNGISKEEEVVLRLIATALDIANLYDSLVKNFEDKMKGRTESMSATEAYKVLGVKQSDDMNTIKKQYRKLIRQYHPDIISSQDKGESYIEEATVKTQEINQAYQVIKELKK